MISANPALPVGSERGLCGSSSVAAGRTQAALEGEEGGAPHPRSSDSECLGLVTRGGGCCRRVRMCVVHGAPSEGNGVREPKMAAYRRWGGGGRGGRLAAVGSQDGSLANEQGCLEGGEKRKGFVTPMNVHRDALCFMVKTWAIHKTTDIERSSAVRGGWRFVAVGDWRLVVLRGCP